MPLLRRRRRQPRTPFPRSSKGAFAFLINAPLSVSVSQSVTRTEAMLALPGDGPRERKPPRPSRAQRATDSLRRPASLCARRRLEPPADLSAARRPTRRSPAGGQGCPAKKRRRLPAAAPGAPDHVVPRPSPSSPQAPAPSSPENGKRGFPSLERRPDTCHLCRAPRTHPAARLPEEGKNPNQGELGCRQRRGSKGREKRKGARR